MGNFYTNVTTRGLAQSDLAAALRNLGRSAFLTPTTDGLTVIRDRECENQDTDLLSSVALTVSTQLSCPAWAFLNQDDDVLWYQLDQGKLVDAYISSKDWWEDPEEPPPQGEAEILCRVMGNPGEPRQVRKVLISSGGVLGYLFEIHRHQALLDALGQPRFAAGLGYKYAGRGELTAGLTLEQMLLV